MGFLGFFGNRQSLSSAERTVDAVFHVQQLTELGAETLILVVSSVVLALNRCKLALPVVDVDAAGELAPRHAELVKLAFMLGLETLALGLPTDSAHLVVRRLEALVLFGVTKPTAQLF